MALTPLSRETVTELHCIQEITNVPSILARGILSHVAAEKIPHVSVAMQEVQDLRARKRVLGGLRLHEYANLYINARNTTMFRIVRKTHSHDVVCVLRISADVLDLPGAVVTDRNAAADLVTFRPVLEGLGDLHREVIFATFWTHPDETATRRHRAMMCAEVLIPHQVDPRWIAGAYVSCEKASSQLRALVPDPGFTITIKPRLFFVP
jgi:hypothetical protein